MANLLKRHEFWLGMFIIALCLLLGMFPTPLIEFARAIAAAVL